MSKEQRQQQLLADKKPKQPHTAAFSQPPRITLRPKRLKMSRRANLIGICGITGLCVLLLVATSQHRPLTANMPGSSAGISNAAADSYSTYMQEHRRRSDVPLHIVAPQPPALYHNLSYAIAEVLAQQRAKIAVEMENFEYPMGRFGVDAEKLADLTPETHGAPIRSCIVTSWRSGSTFLGDILNAMPGNYYHYEPLLQVGIRQIRTAEEAEPAIAHLKKLLKCNYTNMHEYLEFGKSHNYLFEHNERLWAVCKEYPNLCWRAKFLSPFCKLFPLQSMKVVRLRAALAEELLVDKSLNVRIILLVRDPRGTMQSRKHRDWCPHNPDCDDPAKLCSDLVEDYYAAEGLLRKYPMLFRTVRYEDLSINPYEMTQEILQFFGLPFDPAVEVFLDSHTKVNIGGVSSTYRDSKTAPFHWKQDLAVPEIQYIQQNCKQAMELWGYRQIEDFTNYQNTFDPLILPPPFA